MTFIERPGMSQVASAMPSASIVEAEIGEVHGDLLPPPQTRSMMVAVPMPAPMHSVTSAVRLAGALQLVERRAEDHRAGRAERMAHGDGAAVDVDLGGVELEGLHEAQHHRGEGLVDLEQVDVGDATCPRAAAPCGSRRQGR